MNKAELLKKLKALQSKINDNTIDAWDDRLEQTHSVAIQEDFRKGVEESEYFKYNGWEQDLDEIIKELEN